MADFMIRFFICNIFLSGMVGILCVAKKLLKRTLTSRMHYHLWYLFLGLLVVPFLPLQDIGSLPLLSWIVQLQNPGMPSGELFVNQTLPQQLSGDTNWMNNFTLSVTRQAPSFVGTILFALWGIGIFIMLMFVLKSKLHLDKLKKSALPLQNAEVHKLYQHCLKELHIATPISICSTAFLKSPIIVGLCKPCIYLPIHLISDFNENDMRYMLLHELQHYKHKDALANYLMNFAVILYWFNPFVWYALKEMASDREIACDASVLEILSDEYYKDYGNTLINFAEKISHTPFPFASGLSGSMKQLKQRILNIALYEKPSSKKKFRGLVASLMIGLLLISFIPFLSTSAANENRYQWDTANKQITYTDFSTHFQDYEGSFVLYDLKNDAFTIHNFENATTRVAPNSTYKIYDGLFGLEENVITPEDSLLLWNQEIYPIEAWNRNHTLESAMAASVNWYFQAIDQQLGTSIVHSYIQKLAYGNENLTGNPSSYWMESSLKISPLEQVNLLTNLYTNELDFKQENMDAIKNALHISTSKSGSFYGKTGTGRVNNEDVNGWFIGYVESDENTFVFATNIQNEHHATGSKASEISLSILSDLNIWEK